VSPVPQESIDQMKTIISDVLGAGANKSFLQRIDAVLADWSSDKINAAQAAEKVEKMVSLFIDSDKSKEIATRCAPIIMKAMTLKK